MQMLLWAKVCHVRMRNPNSAKCTSNILVKTCVLMYFNEF